MPEPQDLRIGPITTTDGFVDAAQLVADIWGTSLEASPIPADLMVALAHSGGCVLGAYAPDGTLLGMTIGIAGAPGSDAVYSLIAGVRPGTASQGVGRRLKLAQRDWTLARGGRAIVWTYDPLIRRNAHFNLNRLGARVSQFLLDYYPPLHDALNAGDLTDRFYVEWDLTADTVAEPADLPLDLPSALATDAAGGPVVELPGDDGDVLAWIPPDIEALRRDDAALGMRWRLAARAVFTELFARDLRPVQVTPDGSYLFTRGV